MNFLHVILCEVLFSLGFLVCFSINPIESVLYLILSFCSATAILFVLNVEFLGLVFIIIYVGAIAVLFLFVIMMLNIKHQKYKINAWFLCFLILLFYFFEAWIEASLYESSSLDNFNLLFTLDQLYNIDIMGQTMFNLYLICFLIAGLVLLVALIGSIVLTLKFSHSFKDVQTNKQLSRMNFEVFENSKI